MTNHTVTSAPAPVVELDPELDADLAAHVAEVLRALRVLDHHLRGVAPQENASRLHRARNAAHEGVSQMLAASGLHPTARPDAEEVTR
jgi:hypothetical protein